MGLISSLFDEVIDATAIVLLPVKVLNDYVDGK